MSYYVNYNSVPINVAIEHNKLILSEMYIFSRATNIFIVGGGTSTYLTYGLVHNINYDWIGRYDKLFMRGKYRDF